MLKAAGRYLCPASGQWRAREQGGDIMTDAFMVERAYDQQLCDIARRISETTVDKKLEVLYYLVWEKVDSIKMFLL